MNAINQTVSKLHLLETRFSKKAIGCAVALSLGVSAFPLSTFAATISGVKLVDSNRNGLNDDGGAVFTGGGSIYLKLSTAPATQAPITAPANFSTGNYTFSNLTVGTYKVWQYVNPASPVYSLMNGTVPQYFISEATAKVITITSSTDMISSVNFAVPNLISDDTSFISTSQNIANAMCDTNRSDVTVIYGLSTISSTGNRLVIQPNATAIVQSPVHFQSICNKGTLTSQSTDMIVEYDDFFFNSTSGTILGKNIDIRRYHDTNGTYLECDATTPFGHTFGSCEHFASVYNAGIIKGEDAPTKHHSDTSNVSSSNLATYAGEKGGAIVISGANVVQNGTVQGGSGGTVIFDKSLYYHWNTSENLKVGGDGGSVLIDAQKVTGNASSITMGGVGGNVKVINPCTDHNGNNCHQFELTGGDGGEVNIPAASVRLSGLYKGSSIWVDPTVSFVGSDTTLIADKDITIYGGDNWLLELKNLRPESIMAGRKIILATGAGGTIDLRGNNANVFKAGDRVEIYTDNLLLDAGVTIESLVDAPNGVMRSGAKIIYHATITGSSQIETKAGETVNVQLDLRNASPKADSYTLQAKTNDGIVLNGLPSNISVEALKAAPLDLSVAAPANLASESTTITITATSQADPTVIATFELRVTVPQITCTEPATYDTATRVVNLPKIDIPLLSPIDGKETGEIAVFSAQLEQVSGVEDFKIKPNSLQFLNFSKTYDPSHARYNFNTGLFSNGGLLKTCVAVPQVIVIPPNLQMFTTPKHYLVTLRQLAVSADTFHVETISEANP